MRVTCDLKAYLRDEAVSAARFTVADLLTYFRRETRFGSTLDSWGAAMMFQGCYLFSVFCLMALIKTTHPVTHGPYYLLWASSFPFWFLGFFWFRRWKGSTSLVERQLSHLWTGGACIAVMALVLESVLRLPGLVMSPIYAINSLAQSFAMANLLSRVFYIAAIAYVPLSIGLVWLVRTAGRTQDDRYLMAGILILAVAEWAKFFIPGLIYHRRHIARRTRSNELTSDSQSSRMGK